MRTWLLLASMLLFSALSLHPANAADGITFMGAEVQLGEAAHTSLTITFSPDSKMSVFRLPLFYEIQNLKADSNFGNVSCSHQKKPFGSQIECAISLTGEKRMLMLEYDSFDLIKRADSQFLYKQEFHVPMETTSLSFKVMLPEGMFLTSGGTFQPYLPTDGEKGSDGRKIFITWKKGNFAAGESFDTQVSYEASSDNSEMLSLFIGGITGLVITIIALILSFWLFFKRFRKDIKIVLPVLKADEKEIAELLLKSKGNSNQKLLVRESSYSKAKVSKILKSLQERGIVSLERIGRSNNVRLEKNFQKGNEKKESGENPDVGKGDER